MRNHTTQTLCWFNDFYDHVGFAPFHSPKENLKWNSLLCLGKGNNPLKIFRVYLFSESQFSDHLVKISEHPKYLRTEGEGANFKLVVTTAEGEMSISQDGFNHHLVPSSI